MIFRVATTCAFVMLLQSWVESAYSHDIYTGIHGKNGQLCCGGNDCDSTIYREHGGDYQFKVHKEDGNDWVQIPQDRITFLPIPGDSDEDADPHRAHICYRRATNDELRGPGAVNVFETVNHKLIYLYCAFIPPGSI